EGRVRGARVAQWLWGGAPLARVARLPLVPLAALYWGATRVRAAVYRAGWRHVARLPFPTVAVGNLSVGGTGKTPLAAWIARYYAQRGRRPAILLRGYGGDEPLVHQRLAPEAVVVADPDRVAGARAAQRRGADLAVLDDAYQLLGGAGRPARARGGGHRRPGELRRAAPGHRCQGATRSISRSSRLWPGRRGAARAGLRRGRLCCSHREGRREAPQPLAGAWPRAIGRGARRPVRTEQPGAGRRPGISPALTTRERTCDPAADGPRHHPAGPGHRAR